MSENPVDPELARTLDLLSRAQGGDRAALERLFARYYPRVLPIIRVRIGRLLRARVESGDILQDTFLAALRSFDRFEIRDEAAFLNWLARIAEHQIQDAADFFGAQKRNVAREVPLNAGTESAPSASREPTDTAPTPMEQAQQLEQRSEVEQALEGLSEDYRELILWRDFMGASWAVIAEETQRPSADAARMMYGKAIIELTKRMPRQHGSSS